MLFEIGSEPAGTVIPGAGIGVALGMQFKKKTDKKRKMKKMEESKRAME